MTKETLNRQLDQLHDKLLTLNDLDPQTVQSLQRLAHDIRNLLAARDAIATGGKVEAYSLREQIERLEREHPVLTGVLSQITESLASLGI